MLSSFGLLLFLVFTLKIFMSGMNVYSATQDTRRKILRDDSGRKSLARTVRYALPVISFGATVTASRPGHSLSDIPLSDPQPKPDDVPMRPAETQSWTSAFCCVADRKRTVITHEPVRKLALHLPQTPDEHPTIYTGRYKGRRWSPK